MFIFKNFNGVEKKCSGCKVWKPIAEFGKESRSGSGLKPRCKKCCNAYDKSFYPKIKNEKLAREKAKYVKRVRIKKYTELEIRLLKNYRRLIYRLKIVKNGRRTSELLGYTYLELIFHLGKIPDTHEAIDHKIPITWFLDFNECQLINHLQNLQILTKTENSKKKNIYSHPVSFEYFEMVKDKLKPQYKNKISHYGTTN